jgi:hypothetical protein
MHLGVETAAQIFGDYELVPMFSRATRGGLDAYIGGDTAQHNATDAATTQLQVQLRAVICTPLTLGDSGVPGAKRGFAAAWRLSKAGPQLAYLYGCPLCGWALTRDLNRLLTRLAGEQEETTDYLLHLGKRAVSNHH